MNKTTITVCLFACSIGGFGFSAEQPIRLSNTEGVVLPREEREIVLAAADKYLGNKQNSFLSTLDEVGNPFGDIVRAEEVEVAVDAETIVEREVVAVVYDDASVLKVIATNFSKQVRGTLARGDKSYIQLQGGSLMKPGSSFPARIPQAKDKTYTVKLVEVTAEDYTLALGEAKLTLTYSESSNNGVNLIQKNP